MTITPEETEYIIIDIYDDAKGTEGEEEFK
jgi:hypothetical protein